MQPSIEPFPDSLAAVREGRATQLLAALLRDRKAKQKPLQPPMNAVWSGSETAGGSAVRRLVLKQPIRGPRIKIGQTFPMEGVAGVVVEVQVGTGNRGGNFF